MNVKGNTLLITGGGSGIGRGLAEAFHRLGNRVIIAGRRQSALKEVTDANPGMEAITLDLENPNAIRAFGERVGASYPDLNVLVNNGGIQLPEDLLNQDKELQAATAEINTNLFGQIRLTSALLPFLRHQPASTLINVTSGLAFVPMAAVPTYCATKAAMHSYTVSLRHQLQDTSTDVIEIIPPYVQTDLSPNHAEDPRAMHLRDFISEVMEILTGNKGVEEVVVERCKPIRFASEMGKFDEMFKALNQAQ